MTLDYLSEIENLIKDIEGNINNNQKLDFSEFVDLSCKFGVINQKIQTLKSVIESQNKASNAVIECYKIKIRSLENDKSRV